jgi:hypothetical protein
MKLCQSKCFGEQVRWLLTRGHKEFPNHATMQGRASLHNLGGQINNNKKKKKRGKIYLLIIFFWQEPKLAKLLSGSVTATMTLFLNEVTIK